MCIFCAEIDQPDIVKSVFGSYFRHKHRIIYADDNILAIPGYGPQVYPYILVLTKRHIPSFLGASKNEKESYFHFFDVLLKSSVYHSDSLCIFEHGGEENGGCSSITHCHVHVIEGDLGFYNYIDWEDRQQKISISPQDEYKAPQNYLLIAEYREGKMTAKINTSPVNVHQYFRKCLSEIVDCEEWDWRTGINNELWIPKLIDECKKQLVY